MSIQKIPSLFVSVLSLLAIIGFAPSAVHAQTANWVPDSSEKLVRIPAKNFEKAIEKSYSESELASQIKVIDREIIVINQNLIELRDSIAEAESETKIGLQVEFLQEKSRHLDKVEQSQHLRERELRIRLDTYTSVLKKLKHNESLANDPAKLDLAEKQREGQKRLQNSAAAVDELLADHLIGAGSQYSESYQKNEEAISKFRQAVQNHPVNEGPQIDGAEVNREEYVRYLVVNIEADLALLEQEKQILSYMAELVALDSEELTHKLEFGEHASGSRSKPGPAPLRDSAALYL